MATKKVIPGSLTDSYKIGQGDFAPNLVGNQFTDPNAFFTLGNFDITSNYQGRVAQDFKLGEWSDYYCLNNLDITEAELQTIVSNNIYVRLNYDKTNIGRYVYFGSFYKFLEDTIQGIIVKWPAALSVTVNAISNTQTRPSGINTILDFDYDPPTDTSTFKTPIGAVNNPYNLDYTKNPFGSNNIPLQINDYILSDENNNEFVIEGLTGKTTGVNYIYFKVRGKLFNGLSGTTFAQKEFHVKPIKKIRDKFFTNLTDFQNLLLDRLTTPKYNFTINVPFKYEDGDIGFTLRSFAWPTSDGYNLDINTFSYQNYVEGLFEIASLYDENKTDLVLRRFVSDSIIEYDTEGDGTSRTGMRVSKLLRVYGVEFDVVKKYIDGISFANVVTYSKKDNTSDSLIKIMAKTLGFDTLMTTGNGFNLLENDDEGDDPQFSGYSRELSAKQIDVELWRRLVINAWWLFRSKGTRKVLEFFMKLFTINNCLVTMDERVYLAKNKLDLSVVRSQFNNLFGSDYFDLNFDTFPFDTYGFPRVPADTETFWFQNDGFWYNGGNIRTTGNNPHYGVYDFGQRYWDKFRCFVDGFQSTVNLNRTEPLITNYFTEYNNGTFTPDESGQALSNYGEEILPNLVNPDDNINVLSSGLVSFGDVDGPTNVIDSGNTYSLRITFQAGESELCNDCPADLTFGQDGLIYINNYGESVPHDIEECCDFYWLPNTVTPTPKCASTTVNVSGKGEAVLYYVPCGKDEQLIQPLPFGDFTYCYNTDYLPVTTTNFATVTSSIAVDGCVDGPGNGELVVAKQETNGFSLNMLETIVIPTAVVDCNDTVSGIATTFTNQPCSGNGCMDSLFGQLTVEPNTTVDITFNLFGGGTALCCDYNASLTVDTTIHLLNSPANINNKKIISLGEGVYNLKLTLLSYTCTSGYASITVKEKITTIDGIKMFGTENVAPLTGPIEGANSPITNGGLGEVLKMPDGVIPNLNENFYYCWWCPPTDSLTLICNPDDFLLNYDESQILNLATQYGYIGSDYGQAKKFLIGLLSGYFEKGNCFYMINNKILKDKECCELRGGIWNEDAQLCEMRQDIDPCPPIEDVVHLGGLLGTTTATNELDGGISLDNFTVLDKDCCESLGYYSGGLEGTYTDLDGNITTTKPSDLTQIIFENSKLESGCFQCPRDVQEIILEDTTVGVADLNGKTLSIDCCESLGYEYGVTTSGQLELTELTIPPITFCRPCSIKNLSINIKDNTIQNGDGTIVSKYCCESLGYYYYDAPGGDVVTLTSGCYVCPPISSGDYIFINTTINGNNYIQVANSGGVTLSLDCCRYYRETSGNQDVVWDSTIGCYLTTSDTKV
jgi:hypothetical protein